MKKLSRKILSVLLVIAMLVPTGSLMVQTSATDADYNVGDVIEFGSYPQDEVTDVSYVGKSVSLNGKTYSVAPLKWRVLRITDGKALLLSDEIIDAKQYNHTSATENGYYANNYAHSDVREWLIHDFYNTAFSDFEKNCVVTTTLDNSACSTSVNASGSYTQYSSESTSDKVFLLSKSEAENYAKKYYSTTVTDYAYANDFTPGGDSSFHWFLRTAGNNYYQIHYVQKRWGTYTIYFNWYDDAINVNMGIRPAIYLDLDAWDLLGELSENSKAYIQQHVDFANSNTYNNLITNAGFYNALWQYESTDRNFTAYTAWEVLGDIGEIASLNFNNLFVTDNPYDVILADVLSGYVVDNTILNICEKTLEVVFDVDKIANSIIKTLDITDATTLKNTTEAIKSYLSESKKKFIDGVFFSTAEYDFEKKHPGAYETLSSLFPKVKDDKWDDIFGKLKNTSTIIGYINTGSDVVGCFFDAYQKYLIAQTLVESQSEVLGALMVAGYYLPPIAQDLFVEALNDYLDVIDYDSSFSAVCNYALGGSIKNVYNILKEGLKTTVYSGIAKMLGVASGNVNAVVFAYNTTYSLLDYFSGLGEGSELFFLLDSAAMLEDALLTVVQSNANNLKNGSTLEKAKLFDASWSILQAVEQYTYNGLSKYISSIKKQNTFMFAIKTTVGGFFTKYLAMKELNKKNSDADTAIQVAVMFEGEWKNSNCHDKNSQISKVVSVKCPTDVYVYDETENLVLSIVNNKIEVCDIYIAATVDGDEKIFALPDNGKYNIKIVGTDDGTMDYGICDLMNNKITEYTEIEDISLSKDCVYTGALDISETETNYSLNLDYWVCKHPDNNHDGICDSCSEDFTKSCDCMCHSNAFLQFIHKIICFVYRIFGMNEYQFCDCGKAHW